MAASALVVGVGPGLGAALCRALAQAGYAVAAVSRTPGAAVTPGARAFAADAADESAMGACVAAVERELGPVEALVYNAASFHMGALEETSAERFEAVWRASCLGAFVTARAALPAMASRGRGAAIFTGATASLRGGAAFAAFASAKFAMRGLVQSLARAYWPKGVHVAHAVIDGAIGGRDGALDPDAIAAAYMGVLTQPRSAWTQEFDLRPHAEKF